MSEKLKVGVIGVGGIARTHMPGWAASPHTQVVAGSDISEDALKRWGNEHGVSRLTDDAEALLSDPEIDIIDVCTPSSYHAHYAIAALKAGKHVICEKPLAPTPAEIRDMIAARNRSGKLLMTAQHMRFQPDSRAMKAEVDTGVLGDVYHARSWMLRRAAIPTGLGFVLKKNAGGGPCIDIGVHILDLTLWLMGHPKPVSVTGVARKELAGQEGAFSIWGGATVPKEMDVEDFASAFVRFENGATLILEVSWMLHHDTKGAGAETGIWLYGTTAGARWPDNTVVSSNYQTKQLYDQRLMYQQGGPEAHAAECIAFAEAIAKDLPSPVPAEQSLAVQEILDGLYRSQGKGKEIVLSL